MPRAYIGGGWHIHHLSDRVLEIRKEDAVYRRFTGADGFVRVRGEPGIDRMALIERALHEANRADTAMAFRVASDLVPSAQALGEYREQVGKLKPIFETGEEPERIGIKRT
jgi:hypothetical protein